MWNTLVLSFGIALALSCTPAYATSQACPIDGGNCVGSSKVPIPEETSRLHSLMYRLRIIWLREHLREIRGRR